nr:PREDICTED: E3 ubiquitin-protein ligase RNF220-like isoform X2 [Lepisosteus oculatus]
MDKSAGLLSSLSCLTQTSSPKQHKQPPAPHTRGFGVPVTVESSVPFLSGGSYSLGPLYPHPGPQDYLSFPPAHPPGHSGFRHPTLGGFPALPPFSHSPAPHPSLSFPEGMERLSSAYAAALAATMSTNKRLGSPAPPCTPPEERPPPQRRARERDRRQRDDSGMEGLLDAAKRGRRTASPDSAGPAGPRRERFSEAPLSLRCPLCQTDLARAELLDHLRSELEHMDSLPASLSQSEHLQELQGCDQSPSLGSPPSEDEGHKLDRQQMFLQVKTNREARLGVRAGSCRRNRALDDHQAPPVKTLRLTDSEENSGDRTPSAGAGREAEECNEGLGCASRIEGQLGNPFGVDSELDSEPEGSSFPVREKEAESNSRSEADTAISCTGESAEPLRARITALTARLQQRETYRCHVCLDSYSVPVASIQCWHIHCEDCWLRSLGSKKLCPQCNTITSPSDLRRVYL